MDLILPIDVIKEICQLLDNLSLSIMVRSNKRILELERIELQNRFLVYQLVNGWISYLKDDYMYRILIYDLGDKIMVKQHSVPQLILDGMYKDKDKHMFMKEISKKDIFQLKKLHQNLTDNKFKIIKDEDFWLFKNGLDMYIICSKNTINFLDHLSINMLLDVANKLNLHLDDELKLKSSSCQRCELERAKELLQTLIVNKITKNI